MPAENEVILETIKRKKANLEKQKADFEKYEAELMAIYNENCAKNAIFC